MTNNLTTADRALLDLIDTPPMENNTCLVDLGYQGLLAIEGADAAKFLQGQITCDVRELQNGITRLGAQCNIKGRMLVSFRALQLDNERIFLRMHKGLIDKAVASFGKYIVFSKAKLHNRSEDFRRIGLIGPQAETLAKEVWDEVPQHNDEWRESSGNIIIKLDHQRFECWLHRDKAEAIHSSIEPRCASAGENLWTLLDIRAGIGEVRPESYESFTPQSLNYQWVNAVNFRKGCYTGQEIVARLHYRGTLKRHMYRVRFEWHDEVLPLPASSIVNESNQTIGELVMAAFSSGNSAEALINIAEEQLHQAYIGVEQRKKLEHLALPYAIPSEEKD